MEIREIIELDKTEALDLVLDVSMEFEAPDYSEEGINTFRSFIGNKQTIAYLSMYGAYKNEKVVGVIATRNKGNHIALFFVDGQCHKQGIGRKLFEVVLQNCTSDKVTVNSSPYAIEFYHHLGFTDIDVEQLTDGIRYTPMIYTK